MGLTLHRYMLYAHSTGGAAALLPTMQQPWRSLSCPTTFCILSIFHYRVEYIGIGKCFSFILSLAHAACLISVCLQYFVFAFIDTTKRSKSRVWSLQLGWGVLHGLWWLRWPRRVIWSKPRWQVLRFAWSSHMLHFSFCLCMSKGALHRLNQIVARSLDCRLELHRPVNQMVSVVIQDGRRFVHRIR